MIKNENQYIEEDGKCYLIITRNNGEKIKVSIDKDDLEKIKQLHWCYGTEGYVRSNLNGNAIYLHRYITNAKSGYMVDHKDGNPLNNTKENLRACTPKENGRNSRNRLKPNGIIGVRKDDRCVSSYRAQIYFSSKEHIEKTFNEEELAILRRLTWELMYFDEFAPQLELIKEKYPYLLNYFKVKDKMTFNNDMNVVRSVGKCLNKEPHCPCVITKNENTLCPCLACRNSQHCCCGIFVPIGEQEDFYKKKYNFTCDDIYPEQDVDNKNS